MKEPPCATPVSCVGEGDSTQYCCLECACGLFFFLQQCLCVQAFTFIMVIIHGSQWWLLHAVCPPDWHHKNGMAHTLWPALTRTVFICVYVPLLQALGTNIAQALCSSPSKVLFLALFLLSASVCVWVLGVMLGLCSCKRKHLSIATWRQTAGALSGKRDRPSIQSSRIK